MATNGNPRQDPYIEHLDFLLSSFTDNGKRAILNKIVQKVSERKFNRTQYKVKRLKTISGVIHAVIAEINDENSEILVALSVLEDKNKFKVL